MADDYNVGIRTRTTMRSHPTEEDCPKRTQFLAELEISKGREPFTWRKVLGYKEADGAHKG